MFVRNFFLVQIFSNNHLECILEKFFEVFWHITKVSLSVDSNKSLKYAFEKISLKPFGCFDHFLRYIFRKYS